MSLRLNGQFLLVGAIGWLIIISSVLFVPTALAGNALLSEIVTNGDLVLLFAALAWADAALGFRGNSTQVSASGVQRN
ncbi:MAG: hypothetical protein NVSMB38_36070 [Ktedonobacteraceae bacterium]